MGNFDTRWFKGPEFLLESKLSWPITPAEEFVGEEEIVRESRLLIHQPKARSSTTVKLFDQLGSKFQANWASSVRVIAFLQRGCKVLTRRDSSRSPFVTPVEYDQAELVLFREIQREAFSDEFVALETGREINASSRLWTLSPMMGSDSVIRMSTRAQKAASSYAARNPVILPSKHRLVSLMIQHFHEKNLHMGESTTVADIRERAWIIDLRTAVRKTTKDCQLCKIRKATPVKPRMGQLPAARLEFGCKPFTHTGVDCFGPLEVKFGRGKQKRYGIIFTCLTYRAVHLELINDLSTDQCLSAIRRLFTHRGKVRCLYSDNGKNFVGAHNQLARDVSDMVYALGEQAAKKFSVDWKFIPAYSPWMGGAWERLIGSVKRCVEFTLNGEIPHEFALRDALSEAQYQMNRRPLTHMPVNAEDSKPLTPNLMMFGEEEDDDASAPGIFQDTDAVSSKAYRRVQHLAQKYTKRWYREYLPEITRRTKWHKSTPPVVVNALVMLIEPDEKGSIACRRGVVTKIYPGPDGIARQADVRLRDGKTKSKRAVGNLAILDVSSSSP